MSLKPLLSFSSGEIDPILTDNVTLEKFNKGLSTARNVMIGKTGSILSRFSRYYGAEAKIADREIKIYCPPNTDFILEWGHNYVRIYTFFLYNPESLDEFTFTLEDELSHALTEDDLENMHFVTSKNYVYVFCKEKEMLKLLLDYDFATYEFVASADMFEIPNPLTALNVGPVGTPAGYKVDYLATIVINGEESLSIENTVGYEKPIAAGQTNLIGVKWVTSTVDIDTVTEVRIYSRPNGGGAYGLLGTTTKYGIVGSDTFAYFDDIGSLPDYTNGVQDLLTKDGLNGVDIIDLEPQTGTVYQQRLILTTGLDKEALIASRPKFQNNFYRDFPYASDSALLFKAGTSGKAFVLRIIESDGLVVFTTNGVYINSGLLSVNNLGLERKGGWIINVNIPPLLVPGGLFFVDTQNTIRQLIFSQEILAYESIEQTIFSNHLFKERTIKSWSFQDGIAPLIIVSFSDGTFATFTYNFEHQMRAWTRHDSVLPIEQVEGAGKPDVSFFVVNKNGTRQIEVTLPRYTPAAVVEEDLEFDRATNTAFMDGIRTKKRLLNDLLDVGDFFIISPVVADDWEGDLNIGMDLGTSTFNFLTSRTVAVGDIFRFFHPIDKSAIDLEVITVTDDYNLVVTPSEEFPEEYAESARIYDTFNVINGLSHLEGEEVSVMVDGYVIASPYNNVEEFDVLVVSGGSITLPNSERGAIIHVGRPIVADIKTLNITSVEQSPTLLESINVNKFYVRVNKSRGIYASNNFPEEADDEVDGNSVLGMESLDEALIPTGGDLIGNRYINPVSRRIEKTIPGTWDNQGKISFRQVDPFHFEILSIIPDLTVLNRSDR